MLEQLLTLDESLFFIINGFQNQFLDALVPFYRHKLFWAPLYMFIISAVIWNFKENGLWIILFAIFTIGLSDTASSKWVKHSVKRIRPCHDVEIKHQVINRIRCGGKFSFTSSHATNHAAIATFLFFLFGKPRKWWAWALLIWAVTIGFAQVFVGVHYPGDVLGGFLLGGLIGYLFAFLFHRFFSLA